ncbi:hypothetical protein MSG28_011634 [Choristoneura fumiferana]|uniref:Uncharacterized protein n=2 Tax=Choristoneura fumiferana TaxID=7141 RepID=A0ACC0KLD7_CHOFU|nr:hypothetical protein MSG28_011632 [Choristoneura fumiferana]KAI8437248.1 hypothetical protein MSG28_011634 [Choristoneura fumiferana]
MPAQSGEPPRAGPGILSKAMATASGGRVNIHAPAGAVPEWLMHTFQDRAARTKP